MSNAISVVPMLTPDRAAMRQHLTHLFGGYLNGSHDGRIELCWTDANTDASGRYALSYGETFAIDDLDKLIEKAIAVNSKARTNVYIGAALRKPDTAPMGRCNDDDFYAATGYWADLDDHEANARSATTLKD